MLQTVAWASMIVDYSRNGALTEAVEKTFDGRHPCRICKEIEKERMEKKHDPASTMQKIELFDQPVAKFVFSSASSVSLTFSDSFFIPAPARAIGAAASSGLSLFLPAR